MILLNNQNEFLFQLRDNNYNVIEPGRWALFGGGIEKGETSLEGAKREIAEEIPDCFVKDMVFIERGYAEIKNLRLGKYWINRTNKPKNPHNSISELYIFKAIINEKLDYINQKITEGERAGYFSLEQFEGIKLDPFAKNFIYHYKNKIFH